MVYDTCSLQLQVFPATKMRISWKGGICRFPVEQHSLLYATTHYHDRVRYKRYTMCTDGM